MMACSHDLLPAPPVPPQAQQHGGDGFEVPLQICPSKIYPPSVRGAPSPATKGMRVQGRVRLPTNTNTYIKEIEGDDKQIDHTHCATTLAGSSQPTQVIEQPDAGRTGPSGQQGGATLARRVEAASLRGLDSSSHEPPAPLPSPPAQKPVT